jgi:hypothetical protein
MEDNKAAVDEARRAEQHAAMKSKVEKDVNADIVAQAEHAAPAEVQKVAEVGTAFRGKAIDEVVKTDRETGRARGIARSGQFVDYIFFAIYTLLAVRLALALMAANSTNGFVQLIRGVTGPLYAPFRGIVSSPSTEEGNTLAVPILIAIVAYAILHGGIKALMRLVAHRKTEI